jgi:hypothetical protein
MNKIYKMYNMPDIIWAEIADDLDDATEGTIHPEDVDSWILANYGLIYNSTYLSTGKNEHYHKFEVTDDKKLTMFLLRYSC